MCGPTQLLWGTLPKREPAGSLDNCIGDFFIFFYENLVGLVQIGVDCCRQCWRRIGVEVGDANCAILGFLI